MKHPPLPKNLQTAVDDARVAQGMEKALGGGRSLVELTLRSQAEREHREQRHRKAGSYTLAEKYDLLDLFPPTVTIMMKGPA